MKEVYFICIFVLFVAEMQLRYTPIIGKYLQNYLQVKVRQLGFSLNG